MSKRIVTCSAVMIVGNSLNQIRQCNYPIATGLFSSRYCVFHQFLANQPPQLLPPLVDADNKNVILTPIVRDTRTSATIFGQIMESIMNTRQLHNEMKSSLGRLYLTSATPTPSESTTKSMIASNNELRILFKRLTDDYTKNKTQVKDWESWGLSLANQLVNSKFNTDQTLKAVNDAINGLRGERKIVTPEVKSKDVVQTGDVANRRQIVELSTLISSRLSAQITELARRTDELKKLQDVAANRDLVAEINDCKEYGRMRSAIWSRFGKVQDAPELTKWILDKLQEEQEWTKWANAEYPTVSVNARAESEVKVYNIIQKYFNHIIGWPASIGTKGSDIRRNISQFYKEVRDIANKNMDILNENATIIAAFQEEKSVLEAQLSEQTAINAKQSIRIAELVSQLAAYRDVPPGPSASANAANQATVIGRILGSLSGSDDLVRKANAETEAVKRTLVARNKELEEMKQRVAAMEFSIDSLREQVTNATRIKLERDDDNAAIKAKYDRLMADVEEYKKAVTAEKLKTRQKHEALIRNTIDFHESLDAVRAACNTLNVDVPEIVETPVVIDGASDEKRGGRQADIVSACQKHIISIADILRPVAATISPFAAPLRRKLTAQEYATDCAATATWLKSTLSGPSDFPLDDPRTMYYMETMLNSLGFIFEGERLIPEDVTAEIVNSYQDLRAIFRGYQDPREPAIWDLIRYMGTVLVNQRKKLLVVAKDLRLTDLEPESEGADYYTFDAIYSEIRQRLNTWKIEQNEQCLLESIELDSKTGRSKRKDCTPWSPKLVNAILQFHRTFDTRSNEADNVRGVAAINILSGTNGTALFKDIQNVKTLNDLLIAYQTIIRLLIVQSRLKPGATKGVVGAAAAAAAPR